MVEENSQNEQANSVEQLDTPVDTPENTTPIKPETLVPVGDYRTDPLFYSIADYFNVASEDYPIAKDYLSEIVDYAIKETGSNDSSILLEAIRKIEDQVQPPQWGEKRYWNIRKYIRLASKKNDIERAMGAFSKKE